MLSRAARLPRSEFRARGYRNIRTPYFTLKVKKNGTNAARVGVVVPKAVDARATRRNFLKRQVKTAAVRGKIGTNDMLFILAPGITALTKKKLQLELEKSIRAAKTD